jgi:hypothetical protein
VRFENMLRALGAITRKGSDILFCRGSGLKVRGYTKVFCYAHSSRVKPTTMDCG